MERQEVILINIFCANDFKSEFEDKYLVQTESDTTVARLKEKFANHVFWFHFNEECNTQGDDASEIKYRFELLQQELGATKIVLDEDLTRISSGRFHIKIDSDNSTKRKANYRIIFIRYNGDYWFFERQGKDDSTTQNLKLKDGISFCFYITKGLNRDVEIECNNDYAQILAAKEQSNPGAIDIQLNIMIDHQTGKGYEILFGRDEGEGRYYLVEPPKDDSPQGKWELKDNVHLNFHIEIPEGQKIHEFAIHDFLLIKKKFDEDTQKASRIVLSIHEQSSKNVSNLFRLKTYLALCEKVENGRCTIPYITYNGAKIEIAELTGIGKSYPALFLSNETIRLFRNPIEKDIWELLKKALSIHRKIRLKNIFCEGLNIYAYKQYYGENDYIAHYKRDIQVGKIIPYNKFTQIEFVEKVFYTPKLAPCQHLYLALYNYLFSEPSVSLDLDEKEEIAKEIWLELCPQMEIDVKAIIEADTFQCQSDMYRYSAIFHEASKDIIPEKYLKGKFDVCDLRREVFEHDLFRESATKVSFLALLLFAQYDYFYRKRLIDRYKEVINKKTSLNREDIDQNLQCKQRNEIYQAYNSMRRKYGEDVKSIVKYIESKPKSGPQNGSVPHEDIFAEISIATTIAEGLLQLMENAVEYAGGGLLSLRIREYSSDEDDKELMKTKYESYFAKEKEQDFYLEIKLSDLSLKNMREQFLNNVRVRIDSSEITSFEDGFLDRFPSRIYQPFFDPNASSGEEMIGWWDMYYQQSANLIHHYGLQLFDVLICSLRGMLHIGGHGDEYHDKVYAQNHLAHVDENLPGTSYQILLPLRYESTSANSNIVAEGIHFGTSYLPTELCYVCPIKISDVITTTCDDGDKVQTKSQIIQRICGKLTTKIAESDVFQNAERGGAVCVVLNFDEDSCILTSYDLELLIKGILSYLMDKCNVEDEKIIPFALINLPSHFYTEAIRILAMFYNRNGAISHEVNVFLKGKRIGEEIVFAGKDLKMVARLLRHNAVTTGVMPDNEIIYQRLMYRETKHN